MKGLKDRLNNLYAGEVQSVDGMSVVPLIDKEDKSYEEISPIEEVEFVGTLEYGSMKYENNSDDGVGVVPTNHTVISKQRAQDHAMSNAGLVEANDREVFTNACCIQSSQGGRLKRSDDEHMFGVLPVNLRNKLVGNKRREKRYGKLWDDIGDWNDSVLSNRVQALDRFFDEFEEELDHFLAEFEVVKNQIGALIFFGSNLMGIEITPYFDYWNQVWDWLVRGCYGSEYIRQQINTSMRRFSLPDFDDCDDIEEIREEMKNYLDNVRENLLQRLSPSLKVRGDEYLSISGVNLNCVNVEMRNNKNNYVGDVVTNREDEAVYISLVKK